ncbi:MAG: YncE family protein [bacterium]|nr:YncE family protein [bacterium]
MISLRNFALTLLVFLLPFSLTNVASAQVASLPSGTRVDYPVGDGPIGIAFDNITNSVWVTNAYTSTLSKVNIFDGTRIDYVAGINPRGIAFDGVTNSVWVANSGSNTVSKVNIYTGIKTDYPVAIEPFDIAFDNVTNSVWVTTGGTTGIISKVDIFTGARVDFYNWYYPRGVVFDSVTNSIWTGNYYAAISKINIFNGTRIDYPTGLGKEQMYGIAFDNFNNSIWAGISSASVITKVNVFTGEMTEYVVKAAPYGAIFDNTTNSIWVTSYSFNTVSKIDVLTGTRVDYPVGGEPYDIVFDSVTDSVWVTNVASSTISKIAIGAPPQHLPTLSTLVQLKSDGVMSIAEGSVTTESTAVFKATLSDVDNDVAKLQVELKELSQQFDGTNLLESGFVASGSTATTSKEIIADGQYHWRARAVDDNGNMSDWQEFGAFGNMDFKVKTVPLYTQRLSEFPSRTATEGWAGLDYAAGSAGNYSCGSTIAGCGCAISSSVMIMRFHDITVAVDGLEVEPKNINNWLNTHNGYDNGNVNWKKVSEYSKNLNGLARLQFDKIIRFRDTVTLDQYLETGRPAILYSKTFGSHFLVADGKLANTYTIKDPARYNTKNLNDTRIGSFIKNYNNNFDGLRLYSPVLTAMKGMSFSLGSPAELLIIDPLGRRLGKDPTTGILYEEIPEGSYYQEGISNAELENPPQAHENKNIWIPNPEVGQYITKVIGTDTGSYTLNSLAYDYNGDSHSQTLTATTQPAFVDEYHLSVSTVGQPINLDLALTSQGIDECPTLSGTSLGCPAKIDFLSMEKISNSAGAPELISPLGETRYTAPVVSGERGTTEVKAKLYDEGKLLALLNTRSVSSDQLCAIFDDTSKDSALLNHLTKTTDKDGKFSFGVSSTTVSPTLIESVRETVAGQSKRVCIAESVSPRDFVNGIASKEVSMITLTVRNTNNGILVKKTAGSNSQTIDY